MPDAQRIAKEIRDARRERGWTQPELAEAAGVSLRMIQDAEGGHRRPQAAKLDAIRRALGLDANPVDTWAAWDGYTRASADLIGGVMHTFTPDERRELHFALVDWVIQKREEILKKRDSK